MIKYILHPGIITDRDSGKLTHISYMTLIRLYNLQSIECLDFTRLSAPEDYQYRNSKYIHLYPRPNGDYEEYLKALITS